MFSGKTVAVGKSFIDVFQLFVALRAEVPHRFVRRLLIFLLHVVQIFLYFAQLLLQFRNLVQKSRVVSRSRFVAGSKSERASRGQCGSKQYSGKFFGFHIFFSFESPAPIPPRLCFGLCA